MTCNPYYESEFEKEDHFCEVCGCLLSYDEWLELGMCEDCFEEMEIEEELLEMDVDGGDPIIY